MPIGAARLAEPTPGIDIDLAILAAGFAVIVLAPLAVVIPAAWTAAAGPRRAPACRLLRFCGGRAGWAWRSA